jgi:multiple sugar transport system permease protein
MTSSVQAPTASAGAAPVTVEQPKRGFPWGSVGSYASIVIILIWCLAPFYYMTIMAFRNPDYALDTSLVPSHLTLSNFKYAFNTTNNHFGRALVNGVVIGVAVTVIAMAVGVFAAYAMARLQFRFKYLILGGVLAASMFPGVAILTPLFQLFTDLGWLGTYQGLIVPQISGALPLAVFVLTSFFTDMPWELEQAARVDGATPGQAFRLVILPLAAPALFTVAILIFLGVWNEYLLSSVLYNGNDSVAPPTVALAKFTAGPHVIPYTQTMAAGLIVVIPLVIVVLLCQRRIVSGLTAGGVKG